MRSKQKPAKGRKALALYRYRVPMQVREWVRLSGGDSYPRCPRCGCLVDREFMRFCDQCGQRLGWKQPTFVMPVCRCGNRDAEGGK